MPPRFRFRRHCCRAETFSKEFHRVEFERQLEIFPRHQFQFFCIQTLHFAFTNFHHNNGSVPVVPRFLIERCNSHRIFNLLMRLSSDPCTLDNCLCLSLIQSVIPCFAKRRCSHIFLMRRKPLPLSEFYVRISAKGNPLSVTWNLDL